MEVVRVCGSGGWVSVGMEGGCVMDGGLCVGSSIDMRGLGVLVCVDVSVCVCVCVCVAEEPF